MKRFALVLALLGVLLGVPAAVSARSSTHVYMVNLHELNHSGVSGHVILLELDGSLTAFVIARGLVPNEVHMQHIHGFADKQATCPTPVEADANHDGIITFAEGLPFYGPVVVPLTPYPTASAHGTVLFRNTFSTIDNLDEYVVVLHGLTVNGQYDMTLPVACGAIHQLDD